MIDDITPSNEITQNRDEVAEELTRRLFNFADMAERTMLSRRLGTQFEGDRDLYKTFGYVFNPQYGDYKGLYDRQGISTRIVEKFAKDTWSTPAIIIDGDSRSDKIDGTETQFIKEWNALVKRLRIYQTFKQADIMLGFSRYSVIFLGAPGVFTNPAGNATLAYMMAYDEKAATIGEYIRDQKDPKFGMPKLYNIAFNTDESGVVVEGGNTVHHTRIIHLAENKLSSRVFGRPRLQVLINRLFDLEKVTGGGAEAVWLSLIKGFILTSKDGAGMPLPGTQEEKQLNDAIQKFYNRMQRYAVLENVDVHDLGSASPSVRDTFDVLIEDICGSVGISQRILLGSERGQLASDQDKKEWNAVITERRNDFAEPEVLRPFIDWCIEHNVISAPSSKEYSIQWQDVYPMTLIEKVEYANKLATGASTMSGGMPEAVLDQNEWRVHAGLQPRTDQEQTKIDKEIAKKEEEKLKAIQEQQKQTIGKDKMPAGKFPAEGKTPPSNAKQNTFEDHQGRPGQVGGSLPRGAGASESLSYAGHNAPGLQRYNLKDEDYAAYQKAMEMDSPDAKKALERAGISRDQALQMIDNARETAANLPQTRDTYMVDGKYTDERQKLHDSIRDEYLSKGKINEDGKPELFLTGGLPGAGKSSILKKEMYDGYKEKFVIIDSDAIKEKLAAADGLENLGIHAASYHAEADDIISDIFSQAVERRMNIGLDGTMKNQKKMLDVVSNFKDMGYNVEVAFVDLPPQKAMERGTERFVRGGRFVDPVYIASNDHKNPATAQALKDHVDVYRFWNNDVPFGTSPILVDEKVMQ